MDDDKVKLPQIAPSEYTDTSRLIHSGPCIVKSVHMIYIGAGSGECKIYDGTSTLGKLKAHLIAFAKSGDEWRPGDGTDFDYGLYLELGDDVKVTVTYEPESRKDFI